MLFGAVCEKICPYLDRNLLIGTKAETKRTYDGILDLVEFPVREISGQYLTILNRSIALEKVHNSLPVSVSHNFTVLSSEAVARYFPSGL
jgi:hypothetical protein